MDAKGGGGFLEGFGPISRLSKQGKKPSFFCYRCYLLNISISAKKSAKNDGNAINASKMQTIKKRPKLGDFDS